jgi:cell division protein FtsW
MTPGARSAGAGTKRRTHEPDYVLLTVVLMLLIVGLVAVYSSSYAVGFAEHGDAGFFVRRQLMWACIGLGALAVATVIDYRYLIWVSPLLMLIALAALVAVLVPGIGVERNGANRWLALGPVEGQPSEFAKLAVILYLSAWLAAKGDVVKNVALGVVPFVSMVALVGSLILLEPDLGTTTVIALVTGTLFFVSGARILHLLSLVATAAAFTTLLIFVGGYGMQRILTFTSPETDPEGAGFQTLQMLVAFGSGGISGLGLGVSRQKFFYIPGSHTDGVLSIVGEELGFIGVMVVLVLFALLIWRALRIARRAPDAFGSLLATGIAAWISFQMLLNVGGVTSSVPLTGVPLPFLSYGGSALATLMAACGLLLSVSRYAAVRDPAEEPPTRGVVRQAATRTPARGTR